MPATSTARLSFRYARSWLLVAAGRPDLVETAGEGRADAVVLDLEDGVPAELKNAARTTVARCLRSGVHAWVRINDADTAYWAEDLAELGQLPGLAGVVLAKVEHGDQIDATAAALPSGTPIVALLESAEGIEAAAAVAARPGTARLAFGSGDFRRDTGMGDTAEAMAYPRSRLTVASRAAGLPGPIDGPTVGDDEDRLRADTAAASTLGMTARICLRTCQVDSVNAALSPSRGDIDWATRFLEADAEGGSRDGSYRPQLARARALIERAEIYSCPVPPRGRPE